MRRIQRRGATVEPDSYGRGGFDSTGVVGRTRGVPQSSSRASRDGLDV